MRLREVEIHHVDLDAGFTPTGWSDSFAAHLIESMLKRGRPRRRTACCATDLAQSWVVGDPDDASSTTVSGPAGDLAWWMTGRPPAASLTSSSGSLPLVKAW